MNVIIKKRQIIMSALVLALGSAVFVNWYFTRPQAEQMQGGADETKGYSVLGEAQYVSSSGEKTTAQQVESDTLSASRLERQKSHDEAFDKLKAVIDDSSATKAAVDTAAEQLAELTSIIKLEGDIDALVKAKCGFGVITTISGTTAQVVCEKGELNSTAILQMKEIIMQHANIKTENIIIFEAK